jgi:hypothetical protein
VEALKRIVEFNAKCADEPMGFDPDGPMMTDATIALAAYEKAKETS